MKASNTTFVHMLLEEQGQAELWPLLDQEEKQRAASYAFERHRNLYIVAHVFLRKVLSYHTDLQPQEWQFYRSPDGKPYIKNSRFQSMQFNLSHTQGMVVCAINKACEVGADVEGSRQLQYMEQMSLRNYTEREYADIFSINNAEQQLQRFYTYWTLKESLVKALGCGLSMPLKKIGFVQEEKGCWTLESSLKSQSEYLRNNYIFNHKQLPNNYQLAVAVKSDTQKTKNATFCFIDSNHDNSHHWKKHDELGR